jgi:hypothetical protein
MENVTSPVLLADFEPAEHRYEFKLPLWCFMRDANSCWLLKGDNGKNYLPMFTDRDAAQTFVLNSPSIRPAKLRKIRRRREALALMRDLDSQIEGVVWDRLPTVRTSATSSRQYVVYKLALSDHS